MTSSKRKANVVKTSVSQNQCCDNTLINKQNVYIKSHKNKSTCTGKENTKNHTNEKHQRWGSLHGHRNKQAGKEYSLLPTSNHSTIDTHPFKDLKFGYSILYMPGVSVN